jgi:2'-5' RNA ligase
MRLFTAIELESPVKASLAAVQTEVKKACVSGNFTHSENFHLTLVFLGELPTAHVPSLRRAMDDAVRDQTPFTLTADKLGAFSRGGKKIVWVGLSGAVGQLHSLYSRLESNLIAQGVLSQTQSYSPHITLAREVTTGVPLSEIHLGTALPITFDAQAISLMESKREQGRLVYHRLARSFLET